MKLQSLIFSSWELRGGGEVPLFKTSKITSSHIFWIEGGYVLILFPILCHTNFSVPKTPTGSPYTMCMRGPELDVLKLIEKHCKQNINVLLV